MDNRGVTTPLNYVLIMGNVSILVSTLILGVGGAVADQQERGVRAQLEVVGHQFANDLTTVSRLARHGDGSARLVSELPPKAVGASYTITLVDSGGDRYRLELRSTDPDVVAVVEFTSLATVQPETVRGGSVVVTYDPAVGEVVVSD
jgi:hypothetical protein